MYPGEPFFLVIHIHYFGGLAFFFGWGGVTLIVLGPLRYSFDDFCILCEKPWFFVTFFWIFVCNETERRASSFLRACQPYILII
jgi:hypothetical protein